MLPSPAVLCVSDDDPFVDAFESALGTSSDGPAVRHVRDAGAARAALLSDLDGVHCVVLDTSIPGGDALSVLREVAELHRGLPVVVAATDDEGARAAVDAGATDYLVKDGDPATTTWLGFRVERAIEDYRVELSRRNRLAQQRAVSDVGTHALTTMDLDEVFAHVVDRLGTVLDAQSAVVLERVDEAGRLRVAAASGVAAGHVGEFAARADDGTQVAATYRRGQSFVVDDVGSDERFDARAGFVSSGLQSAMSVPVGGDANRWGVLCVHATYPGAFTDDDVLFLENVAAIVGAAVDRHDLRGALSEVLERIDEAVIGFDTNWRLTYVNAAAEGLLDEPAADLFGRQMRDLVPEGSRFVTEFEAAMETQGPREFEAYSVDTDTWYAIRAYPSESGLSVYFTDVTERRARETEVQQYGLMLETVGDAVYALDGDGRFTAVNPAFERLTGLTRADVVGEPADLLTDVAGLDGDDAFAGPATRQTVEFELVGPDETPVRVEDNRTPFVVDGEAVGSVGVLRDVTERYRYERLLATLHDRTREMMGAPDRESVLSSAVAACDEVLGDARTELFVFDETQGLLSRVGGAGTGLGDKPIGAGIDDGGVWDAFVAGDVRVVEVAPDGGVVDGVERVIAAPLGRHGVLVTGHPGTVAPNEVDVELVNLLTATVEELLERIDAEAELRERDRRLAAQNEALTKLDRVNATIRGINQSLVRAPTRDDALASVSEHLAETDDYAVVWYVDVHEGDAEPTDGSVYGADGAYVDRLREVATTEPFSSLVDAAVDSREMQTVDDVLGDPAWSDHRGDALTYDFRAIAVIPAVSDEQVEALLVVHATTPGGFDGGDGDLLAELGETVGYAIASTSRAGAMLTERRVELEVELTDDRLSVTNLARRVERDVSLTGVVPQSDGSVLAFVVTDADPDVVVEAGREIATEARLLSEDDAGNLFELRLPREALFETLYASEATLRELRSTGETTTLTVAVPERLRVRSFVDAVRADYPSATLHARRTLRDGDESPATFASAVREEWTARQYESLRTAYLGGFFEWPRRSTSETLADALGISAPTFQYHLRAAERKLIEAVFD